jgi:hypothetical protein
MKVAFLWCAALVAAALLLITADYRSRDPDSAVDRPLASCDGRRGLAFPEDS